MNDRELLELAAKAAGFYVCNDLDFLGLKVWGPGLWVKPEKYGSYELWNPLDDDGDALRLAVLLHLSLTLNSWGAGVGGVNREQRQVFKREKQGEGGLPVATRRAIVSTAAEMGSAKC